MTDDELRAKYDKAMEHLASLVAYAYQNGFHELGYDPLERVSNRVRDRDQLAAELALWKPLTPEEAEAELGKARAVPMSEEKIAEIVKRATDPAERISNSEQAQLAAEVERLKNQVENHCDRIAKQSDALSRSAELSRENAALREQVVKLQAFKDWVHNYLDMHSVPHHPPGTHGAAGCRIGDRMDWLMAEHAALHERLAKVVKTLREYDPNDPQGFLYLTAAMLKEVAS